MAVNTIGTGGDFSTPQLWEDSLPAVLTEPMTGQLLNQEFTSAVNVLDFSAHTTSVANFILLECAAGASFMDNAAVRSNTLRYNASNGAGMRATGSGRTIRISGTCDHITFQGLQLANTGNAYQNQVFSQGGAAASSSLLIKDCILEETIGATPVMKFDGSSSGVRIINCLIIQRSGSSHGIEWNAGGTLEILGCTIVAPSNNTSTGIGINKTYNIATAVNTAVFGFATDAAGLNNGTDNNATSFSDAASGFPDPATDHNVYSVTYDNALFVQTSDAGGNQDFRLLANTLLQDAGLFDSDSSEDISGFPRSDPPDIGAWEAGTTGGASGNFGYLRKNDIEWLLLDDDDFVIGLAKFAL
jgi:hypothetical protein